MVTRQSSCTRGAHISRWPTSVSSVFCNSAGLLAGDDVADRPQNSEPDEGNVALPLRCRPALALASGCDARSGMGGTAWWSGSRDGRWKERMGRRDRSGGGARDGCRDRDAEWAC